MVLGSGTGDSPPPEPPPLPAANVIRPWAEVVPEFEVEGASSSEPVGSANLPVPASPKRERAVGDGIEASPGPSKSRLRSPRR